MEKKPVYETPKVSKLDGNKSIFGGFGPEGKCNPAGSNAETGCMSGTGVGEIEPGVRHCVAGTDCRDWIENGIKDPV